MDKENLTDREKYERAIKLHAEAIENHQEQEDTTQPINEAVFEAVDSDRHIMYYSKNLDVLQYGDSEPMELYKQVEGDWREVIQAMAFEVMEQDIYEYLRENTDLDM